MAAIECHSTSRRGGQRIVFQNFSMMSTRPGRVPPWQTAVLSGSPPAATIGVAPPFQPTRPAMQVITPHPSDLGDGFLVHRALPSAARRAVGPFVFLDQFG